MIVVYLLNGATAKVPGGVDATTDQLFPEGGITGAMVCVDKDGKRIAYFKFGEVLGWNVQPDEKPEAF